MSTSFSVPTDFSNTSNSNYEPIPSDNHVACCIGVIDMGTHLESYQGGPEKPQHKVKVQFELPGVVRDDGKAAIISQTFNCSMNEKATFRQTLDAWLGADWPEKHKGQPWSFLIGKPAMVLTQQGPSKRDPSRVSVWIDSVTKFPKGMPAPQPTRDTFYLDLSNKELPAALSFWDADKIRQSREYKAGGFRDDAPKEQPSGGGSGANGNGHGGVKGTIPPATPPGPTRTSPSRAFDETEGEVSNDRPACPAAVAPLVKKYGLSYPFKQDDLDIRKDDISPRDLVTLETHAIPF